MSALLLAFLLFQTPPVVHKIAAGDFDGDGRDEVVRWDGASKKLSIWKDSQRLTERVLERFPSLIAAADLDGDRRSELLIGEGLRGYNPKEGPQTDVHLRIYRPLSDGPPEEIFRHATERPNFTGLEVADLDGDGRVEIVFGYFASKYMVDLRVARRADSGWKMEALPKIRMGMSLGVGDIDGKRRIVIGRPYGEDIGELGDAFILDGARRLPLPVFRGVSSIAVGRLGVFAGDGWHQDYGKVARARLAVMRRSGDDWKYQLIEDVPENVRLRDLALVDLDGDGNEEVIALGERRRSLGGDVRLYRLRDGAWQATTLARDVQGFAIGRFGGESRSAVFAGDAAAPVVLDVARLKWDAALAPEVETYKVDAATLLGKPAPALGIRDWLPAQSVQLSELRGKVVLLDFWATWCKPCIAAFPRMKEWLARWESRGFVILGLTETTSQARADVVKFLGESPLPWRVGIDTEQRAQMNYGVGPIPHAVLIGRDGAVKKVHVGSGAKLDELEKAIEQLIAAQP